MGTHTAAVAGGILVSYRKNPATPNTEIMRGARTVADPHPAVEPDVTAKMNRIRAAMRVVNINLHMVQRRAGFTCEDRHANHVELLPPPGLRLVDASNRRRREEHAQSADGDGEDGDKPEHP